MLHNPAFTYDIPIELRAPLLPYERVNAQPPGLIYGTPCTFEKGDEGHVPFVVVLPVDAARREARNIIRRPPENGYVAVVQDWMQLTDGLIQFKVGWIKMDK